MSMNLRLTIRVLRRSPSLSVIRALVLSAAVAMTTVTIGLVNTIVFPPLPFSQPEHLRRVTLVEDRMGSPYVTSRVSGELFEQWTYAPTIRRIAAIHHSTLDNVFYLTGDNGPEQVHGAFATSGLFETLGASAALGRVWSAPDPDVAVAVISHDLWRTRFGADSAIIGRSISISNEPHVVIGVLDPHFIAGNPDGAVQPGTDIQIWVPVPQPARDGYDEVIVRLASNVTELQAEAELTSFLNGSNSTVELERLDAPVVHQAMPLLRIVIVTVLVAFLLVCVNLTGLELLTIPARRREIAVRVALGAGPRAIGAQVILQVLVLGIIGTAGGLLISLWLRDLLVQLMPTAFARARVIELDFGVFATSVAFAVAALLTVSVAPLYDALRTDPIQHLPNSRSGTSDRRSLAFSRLMATLQLGLVFALVAMGILLARSAARVIDVETGVRISGVGVFEIHRPPGGRTDHWAYYRGLRDAVAAHPDVVGVALTSSVPFRPRDYYAPGWNRRVVDEQYFTLLGIPIIAGREFNRHDHEGAEQVAIISEGLARLAFQDGLAVGRNLDGYYVVGVVGSVRHNGADQAPIPTLYTPLGQTPDGRMTLLVRTEQDQEALALSVQRLIMDRAPDQPVTFMPLAQAYERSAAVWNRFFVLNVIGVLASAALGLAIIGCYGTFAQLVAQQRHELGIRVALGATRSRIVATVISATAPVIVGGIVGGMGAVPILGQIMQSFLFGVTFFDPGGLAIAASVIMGAGLLAAYIPARRAAGANPLAVFRAE